MAKDNKAGSKFTSGWSDGNRALAWSLVVALLALYAFAVHFGMSRYHYPGQWIGLLGKGERLVFFSVSVCLVVIACIIVRTLTKKNWSAFVVIALAVITSFLPIAPTLESRALAERASYLKALQTGVPFGDQHQEVVNGRKLTYWRWMVSGIDNAIGVIHDPEGRLSIGEGPGRDDDRRVFAAATSGLLFRIKPLGDGLYLVWHS